MSTKNSAKSIITSILSSLLAIIVLILVAVIAQLIFYLIYFLLSKIPVISNIVNFFIGLALWPFKLSDIIVYYVSGSIATSIAKVLLDTINKDRDTYKRSCYITGMIMIIFSVISILLDIIGIFFGVPFDGTLLTCCIFVILFGITMISCDI